MAQSGKASRNSMLGQFRDEVVGEAKTILKDTAKHVAQEPKKILESILGKAASKDSGDSGIESTVSSGGGSTQQQQQLLIKKHMEDKERSAKLLQLHRQRLKEEEDFHQRRMQEKVQEEQVEEQKEAQKKSQIVQLRRDRGSIQKERQLQGRLGSKEQGKKKVQ